MSRLLYIDTSANLSLVMIINQGVLLAERSNGQQTTHGQVINKLIEEVMEESAVSWSQLDSVCVLNGPGSYTGLRISLATAKGICYAQNLPLILINKFDLMYAAIDDIFKQATIHISRKAREDEYITATYSPGIQGMNTHLFNKSELLLKICTHESNLFVEEEEATNDFPNAHCIMPKKTDIARLCDDYYHQKLFADVFLSEPFYMKNVFINKINKL